MLMRLSMELTGMEHKWRRWKPIIEPLKPSKSRPVMRQWTQTVVCCRPQYGIQLWILPKHLPSTPTIPPSFTSTTVNQHAWTFHQFNHYCYSFTHNLSLHHKIPDIMLQHNCIEDQSLYLWFSILYLMKTFMVETAYYCNYCTFAIWTLSITIAYWNHNNEPLCHHPSILTLICVCSKLLLLLS